MRCNSSAIKKTDSKFALELDVKDIDDWEDETSIEITGNTGKKIELKHFMNVYGPMGLESVVYKGNNRIYVNVVNKEII